MNAPTHTPMKPTTWLTLNEAANHVRLSRKSLERKIAAGVLRSYRFGSKILVTCEDVEALLFEQAPVSRAN